ncbi:unnamed protein product [Soboliphyme baturini]|uniref:LIM zinc-binding domain-containing protein n=1 Tax=Soboliphyme baturini TaxID=241478 RepID=A0A183ITF9_9BILA|nr:unnamed protein product [Soboliphyme baturini]
MLESIRSISLGSSKKGPTIPYSSHGTWSPASVVRCKDDFLNEGVRLRVQKTDPCNKRQPLPQLVDWNRNRSESCSGTSIPRPSKVCPRIGNGSPVDELCAECGFCVTHDRVSVQKILYHRGCFKCTQ